MGIVSKVTDFFKGFIIFLIGAVIFIIVTFYSCGGDLYFISHLYKDYKKEKREKIIKKADEYFSYGKYNEAINTLKEISDDYPDDPDINALLGLSFYFQMNYSSAKEYLKKSILRNPKDEYILSHLGAAYLNLMDYNNAELYFKKSLNCKLNFMAYRGLGIIYHNKLDFDKSLFYLKNCLNFSLKDAKPVDWSAVYMSISTIYTMKHDLGNANYYAQKGLDIYPTKELYLAKGVILGLYHDKEGSIKYLKKSSEMGYPLAKKMLEEISNQ
jgi:tetratricopeptide (TPR) repeat protein